VALKDADSSEVISEHDFPHPWRVNVHARRLRTYPYPVLWERPGGAGAERRFFAKQKILLGLDGLDRRNGHDRRLLAAEKSAILGEANKEEVFEETQ